MSDTKKLEDEQIEKVAGGGFFSPYDDEEYIAAGIEIIGPGRFYNDGYRFQDQEITSGEATILVEFYKFHGRIASALQEALDWYDTTDETYQINI